MKDVREILEAMAWSCTGKCKRRNAFDCANFQGLNAQADIRTICFCRCHPENKYDYPRQG